jgi:hypothetical protein
MINKEVNTEEMEFNYNLYNVNGNTFVFFKNLKKIIQNHFKKSKVVRKEYHLDYFMSFLVSFNISNDILEKM